jgi:hypothetical protein
MGHRSPQSRRSGRSPCTIGTVRRYCFGRGLTLLAQSWTSSPAAGGANPEVVEFRDPTIDHTDYFEPADYPDLYPYVGTIWAWLYAHPRVP